MKSNHLNLQIELEENVELQFMYLANKIINSYYLVANESKFEIAEIEFYYFDEKKHKDTYTHCHKK